MTLTAINNNLPIYNSPKPSRAKPEDVNKISNVYLGPGYTNMPGITNLLATPQNLKDSIMAAYKAYQIDDREGIFENGLRATGAPFGLFNASLQFIETASNVGAFFKSIYEAVSSSMPGFKNLLSEAGIIFSAVDGVIEVLGWKRSSSFLHENYLSELKALNEVLESKDQCKIQLCLQYLATLPLPDELKKIITEVTNSPDALSQLQARFLDIKEKIYLKRLQELKEKYFEISPIEAAKINNYAQERLQHLQPAQQQERVEKMMAATLLKKKNCLVRRAQQRMTDQLEKELPKIIRGLNSLTPKVRVRALQRAEDLLNDLCIQSQKNLLISSFGIAAVVCTIAAIILQMAALAAAPYLTPLIIILFATLFSYIRYYLFVGMSETKGWKFDLDKCLPEFLRRKPPRKIDLTHVFQTAWSKTPTFACETYPWRIARPSFEYMSQFVFHHMQNGLKRTTKGL